MRWRCTCAYDGTDFEGWQSQVGGNTVQDTIEARLGAIFKRPIRVHGAGRTDAGVHARGQVFHFDADWSHGSQKLLSALSASLRRDIQITSIAGVNVSFHARFSALRKRYVYRFYLGQASPFETRYCWSVGDRSMDLVATEQLAQRFLGTHDFTALAATHHDGKTINPEKTLYRLEFQQEGKKLQLIVEGSGFLYKMVRTIAGTLLQVGRGALTADYVWDCLEKKERREKIVTAPAHGLCLDRVFYAKNFLQNV